CIAELLRRHTLLSIEQEQTLCSDRRNDKKNNAPWRNRFVCICQKRDHGNVEWYRRELEGDQRGRKLAPGRLPANNWGDRRQQEIPSGIGCRCGGDCRKQASKRCRVSATDSRREACGACNKGARARPNEPAQPRFFDIVSPE